MEKESSHVFWMSQKAFFGGALCDIPKTLLATGDKDCDKHKLYHDGCKKQLSTLTDLRKSLIQTS